MIKSKLFLLILLVAFLVIPEQFFAQSFYSDSAYIATNYSKIERNITMRDGKKLFTSIYIPIGSDEKFPILMTRTPYGCDPYGEKNLRKYGLGPNKMLMREKYIFVYQDVRGRYKSEGEFQEMTPAIDIKKSNQDIDESSDTYDTVEWLLKNIDNNNGNVGLWGISYPGFYALAALPDAHPAIKAVSPQAPVTDEFAGDDCNHNGAFFLMDNFNFYNYFDGRKNSDGEDYEMVYGGRYRDAYTFFLKMGGIANSMKSEYFGKNAKIWNQVVENDTYNAFWKARNILPHLKNIKPAVMIVGGWFDCQDLYGPLKAYEAIKKQSPNTKSYLVMGPWSHGAWAAADWSRFGTYDFGSNMNAYYQEIIETPFFNYYLKNKGEMLVQEANIFEVGSNKWPSYSSWPHAKAAKFKIYFDANARLTFDKPYVVAGFDEYLSDPNKPVPYVGGISSRTNSQYMIEDQRFA
ncbi:MAG: CocE/NonD family hydrolase, partial [Saprospiraceae bacterium]